MFTEQAYCLLSFEPPHSRRQSAVRLVSQLNFLDGLLVPIEVDVSHEFSKLIDKCNSDVRDQGPGGLCSRLCFVPVIQPLASESIGGLLSTNEGLFLCQRRS